MTAAQGTFLLIERERRAFTSKARHSVDGFGCIHTAIIDTKAGSVETHPRLN